MNIKLEYLYRDAGNYKQFNEVIFSNTYNLSLAFINTVIYEKLIDDKWFIAEEWELPDLHFKEFDWSSELDHDWHELIKMEETDNCPNRNIDISQFLEILKRLHV